MADNTLKIMSALEEFQRRIDSKNTLLFSNNVVIKKSEFVDLIETIKHYLPEEVQRCQLMMQEITAIKLRTESVAQEHIRSAEEEAKAILDDARAKADEMIARANRIADEMVSQHTITERAKEVARDINNKAQTDAKMMLDNAYQSSLGSLQQAVGDIEHARNYLHKTIKGLEERKNRNRQ
ncbi:MAG: hypothetical protein Q4A41_00405 [Bacillota bacterium]|nr:hypothetical protein [Bacillota bacterium]